MDTTTAECYATHLIEGDGTFKGDGLDNLIKQVKLAEYGHSYVIVSIMGPQSSGKSTLLNHLFHTNFEEMNSDMGRIQTTKGIWIARCVGIEPCTIVMDIEGTDGQEREDDTVFEKQSALFAMAVSDIVILNMWCHDIGREQAANKPLLKTVFEVMLRLFSPRKITLMFVIRDKTKTPLEVLESSLRKDIQKMWDSVPKPEANKFSHLSEFFYVEVVALSNYENKEEEFKEQVASLRQKFVQSIAPGGLASDRRGIVPASGLSLSVKKIWELVKGNEDLKLPAHMVMVATIRCEEIASEKYSSFATNQDWLDLEEDVQSRIVPGFGMQLDSLLDICLSNYDEEVTHYDGTVGSEKRQQLHEKLMQLLQPTHKLMFRCIRSEVLDTFKTALRSALNEGEAGFAAVAREHTKLSMKQFDELCRDATSKIANFDSIKIRDKVSHDLISHIINLQAAKLSELTIQLADKRIHVGPWGGTGGGPWEFIPDGRITQINIRCIPIVYAIGFNYTDSNGNNHQSSNFGGSEGALTEVHFADDEELVNIKGRVGDFGYYGTHTVITSLTFVTNKATYGPYGKHNGAGFFIPKGTDFSLPLSKGRIIGFYGKSGIYLDQFGVVLSS